MQQHFRLIIFLIQPYMLGRQIRPSSGALFDCMYSFWYNPATLLPTGATVEMEPISTVGSKVGALYQKLYIQSKSAPEDGRSPETSRAELKRLINEKVVASCWLFTSLY